MASDSVAVVTAVHNPKSIYDEHIAAQATGPSTANPLTNAVPQRLVQVLPCMNGVWPWTSPRTGEHFGATRPVTGG